MPAKAIMVQGTGSHVGKSVLAAALCRIFAQDGYRVAPFKAQNMSNNSDVTPEGGEISRAQSEQAKAAGVTSSVLMNPILLKPTTDVGAQVIVLGQSVGTMTAREYQTYKPKLLNVITQSLEKLSRQADILVIEGAGSPAEINLKADDLVNMWVAKQLNAPVLLVGDIDRGGVFAQLVGTMELLDEDERRLVRGFVINKFRGDPTLLTSGLRWLEARYGRPVLGVLPYLHNLDVAEEDSLPSASLKLRSSSHPTNGTVTIAVIRLPRMSNFTDFDALRREPDVHLQFLDAPPSETSLPDAVILPGTKSTIADLSFIRRQQLDRYLQRCREAGREVIGVCGGFQMLGQRLLDPDRIEAARTEAEGLGWLPFETRFHREKTVCHVLGHHVESGLPVSGYEIHMGRLQSPSARRPVVQITQRSQQPTDDHDGMQSEDGGVWGTYLHGLFDEAAFRRWWLNRLRARRHLPPLSVSAVAPPEAAFDQWASVVRSHLNMNAIYEFIKF
ncbi:MAG: cobyric acid synthase [Candidatus Omnitrophica bacterium]|nr:cobyric acid synthase [Candidatus Omnitrophota bacterium]